MFLAVRAHRLRAAARQALFAEELEQAQSLACQSEAACSTPVGKNLALLARWLLSEQHRRKSDGAPGEQGCAAKMPE